MDFINKNIIFKTHTTKNYAALKSDIMKISARLRAFESVEIFLSSSYDFTVSLLGALHSNTKAFILSKESASQGCKRAINDSNFADFLGDSSEDFADDSAKKGDFNADSSVDSKSDSIESDSASADSIDFSACLDTPFFIQTSGTSKEHSDIIPKTLRKMILESQTLAKTLSLKSDDIFIASPSHQHLFALTFKIFLPLFNGGIIIDSALKFPELVIEFCKNHKDKNVVFISSPTLLKYLCEYDLSNLLCLKYIISAGAKLDSAIFAKIKERLKIDIFEVYGSTECGVIAFKSGESFTPFSGVSLRLSEDSTLIINSNWAISKDFVSKDLAEIKDGRFYLKGRIDRIIKIHDKRISLDYVESQIKQLDIIKDCCVGVVDSRIHCIIVLNSHGRELFLSSGKKGIIKAMKILKMQEIRSFYIRENLPFNNQGKISRKDFLACINAKILPELRVVNSDENALNAVGYIDCGSFIFDGHFADFPLMAGFIELDFVIRLAKKHFNLGETFEIESVKFTSFLRPFDEVKINVHRKNLKLYFSILANDKECANGRIR